MLDIEKIRAAAQASSQNHAVREGFEELLRFLEHILGRLDELEYDIDQLKRKLK